MGRCGCRVGTGTAIGQCLPGFHNPEIFETLPNARLSPTARDVFDILTAHQEASGLVRIRQTDLAKRLDISQAAVSRAIGQLKDKGILDGRHRQGTVLIRPLLAAYESLAHMINHLQGPTTFVWPLNYPTGEIRPPRPSGGRLHFAGRCPARPGGPTAVRSAAYGALTQHAEVRVGDTVFATGAVGAVGTLAGPIARLLGARRVIGSTRSPDKAGRLRAELGFDAVVVPGARPIDEQLARRDSSGPLSDA